MRYRVTHRTEYSYGEPVPLCHNVLRLRPRETWRQTCLENAITLSPIPAAVRDFVDFFGNHASWVVLQEPHERLTIEAVSEVLVNETLTHEPQGGPPWEQVAAAIAGGGDRDLIAVKEYTFDTPDTAAHPDLAEYARPSFAPGRPIVDALMDLTQRIYDEFEFDPSASAIGTPAIEVLNGRRGVCQDFAHLQIGCLRSLGLAARYVSGYVLTHPPPGQKRLVGCDASHAWVSAFVPGVGWIDFDPTNAVIPAGEHVTLAWGRDYDDICPVKGVIVGGHRHSMYYAVDVEPVEEEPEEAPAEAVLASTPVQPASVQPDATAPEPPAAMPESSGLSAPVPPA